MYTPGPWCIHNNGKPLFGYWHIRQNPKDWNGRGYQAICTLVASKKGTNYSNMFHANARLIAAAPDLLAVLIDLHAHCTAADEYMRAAEFVIAKVQGKSNVG